MAFIPHPDTLFSEIGIRPEDMIAGRIVSIDGAVLRKLISMAVGSVRIDEQAYLRYPDLEEAKANGAIADVALHYRQQGFFEGRFAPPADFDASWYLDQYVDVKLAVEAGATASALAHYMDVGAREWRAPSPDARADLAQWFNLLAL